MLTVDADVLIDIEGQQAHLTAEGQMIHLEVESLRPFAEAGLNKQTMVNIANLLHSLELSLTITDPEGPLLEMGHEITSSVSQRLIGTRHVRVRRPISLLSYLWQR